MSPASKVDSLLAESQRKCPTPCEPMDCGLPGSSIQWDFPGKSIGVGCHFLLQGIFLTQGLNPDHRHCRQMILPSEPQGKPFWRVSSSVTFSSVTQLCLTLCDPMDYSTTGFPVLHHLPELTQTHIRWVSDAIPPSCPLSSPVVPFTSCLQSFPASGSFLMSQLFASVAKGLELQHQSFRWIFRVEYTKEGSLTKYFCLFFMTSFSYHLSASKNLLFLQLLRAPY